MRRSRPSPRRPWHEPRPPVPDLGQRIKILVVCVALTIWGSLLPIVYGAFGQTFREIIDSGFIPEELTQFGGGDIFTLSGSISLGASTRSR